MSDEPPVRRPLGEDARIDALEERLRAAQEREDQRIRPKGTSTDANYRSGSRVLADLLGGILGGLVIGGAVDYSPKPGLGACWWGCSLG